LFETPRRLFDRYCCKHVEAKTPGFDQRLASEARVRLCQVHELYDRLVRLEKDLLEGEMRADPPPSTPGIAKIILHDVATPPCDQPDPPLRPFTSADEVRISLEAFYYNASRVRDLCRDSAGLPGLQNFEAGGVRDVRHHLVEHPTRSKGVKVMSIALGGPVGPQLKPMRWSEDPPGTLDKGLHANAREFCSALESTLVRALGAGAA
jgi:hypothetical protein